jgi:preprotein translocase subunit SecE
MSNVETVTSLADKLKAGLALLAAVSGVVAFYLLGQQTPLVLRVLAVLGGFVLAVAIAWLSEPGRRFIGFSRESYHETRRVVWPVRKESLQTTAAVFAFVAIMAIFLFVVDKTIEWTLYDLILGWKR